MNAALIKARKARTKIAARRIWAQVKEYKHGHPECHCKLRQGMSLDDLRPLGVGCTGHAHGGWICPVLDAYRRLVPQTKEA